MEGNDPVHSGYCRFNTFLSKREYHSPISVYSGYVAPSSKVVLPFYCLANFYEKTIYPAVKYFFKEKPIEGTQLNFHTNQKLHVPQTNVNTNCIQDEPLIKTVLLFSENMRKNSSDCKDRGFRSRPDKDLQLGL